MSCWRRPVARATALRQPQTELIMHLLQEPLWCGAACATVQQATGLVSRGAQRHRLAKLGTDLLQDRRRRDLIAEMRGQKRDHLPHITVDVDPIQALDIPGNAPLEHTVTITVAAHRLPATRLG